MLGQGTFAFITTKKPPCPGWRHVFQGTLWKLFPHSQHPGFHTQPDANKFRWADRAPLAVQPAVPNFVFIGEVSVSFHSLYFVTLIFLFQAFLFFVSSLCLLCDFPWKLFARCANLSWPHCQPSKACQRANDLLKASQARFWSRQPMQSEQALDKSWHSDLWDRRGMPLGVTTVIVLVWPFAAHLRSLHQTGFQAHFEPANKCVTFSETKQRRYIYIQLEKHTIYVNNVKYSWFFFRLRFFRAII